MGIRFPTAKLADFAGQEAELLRDDNVFALVTLAHLKTQATSHDMGRRFEEKWRLTQMLYQRGWEKQRILDLYHVIDWMMHLPEHLAKSLWQNIEQFEEKMNMRYVSTVERFIIEREKQQGIEQGRKENQISSLTLLLTSRFGELSEQVADQIHDASANQLQIWFGRAVGATTMEDVFRDLPH